MKKQIFITLLAIFFTVFAMTVSATDASQKINQVKQQVEQIQARLNLTAEQKEQTTPIFEKSMEKRQSILKSYGIDLENRDTNSASKIGFGQIRQLKKAMDELRANTLIELTSVLTDEQLSEYKKIQAEMISKMRSRIISR